MKKVEVWQCIITIITAILMCTTLGIQLFCNRSYTEVHLCIRTVIVILSIVLSIMDSHLGEVKNMYIHLFWAVIWCFNAIAIVAFS
jgi:hypothetical protein